MTNLLIATLLAVSLSAVPDRPEPPKDDAVNGLKIRLSADRTEVKPGDTIKLTTTLWNTTDKPLNVRVGYTTCGNYFECGSALRRVHAEPGKPATEFEPKCQVGYCGTGAGPIYVTIAPKKSLDYQTLITLAPQQSPYTLGSQKHFTIDSARNLDDFRMVLAVGPGENTPRPIRPGLKGEGIRPTNEDAPFWTGTLRSNELRLNIVQPK